VSPGQRVRASSWPDSVEVVDRSRAIGSDRGQPANTTVLPTAAFERESAWRRAGWFPAPRDRFRLDSLAGPHESIGDDCELDLGESYRCVIGPTMWRVRVGLPPR
jgi:hypothetical protein